MSDLNPRAVLGGNEPPLTPPDKIAASLELEHAELFSEASMLAPESTALPERPATDEECAEITDFVVRIKRVTKRLEDARTEAGRPYLDAGRNINALFREFTEPLVEKRTGLADQLTERVGIYNRAKAEREAAERREREAEERRRAEAARREEERQRQEAAAAQRRAEEEAARIRNAKNAEEREAAQQRMQEEEARAAAARRSADKADEDANKAERRADVQANIAERPGLGRVSASGSTSSVTKEWAHAITDATALLRSLGPLAPHISNDTISQAIGRAVREHVTAGSIKTLEIPGVRIFQQDKVNVRAARA